MATDMNPLYDKKYACPACDHTFQTKKVRSSSQAMVKRDTDFCTYYKHQQFNPILYTVNVCPGCGYSFTDQFGQLLRPFVKKSIQEKLSSKWTSKDYGELRSIPEAIVTYKLAIYAAELKGELHSVKAGLYLRLAWLYRFQGNQEEQQRFLQMAVSEYEQSYIHSDYIKSDKEMSEVRMLYLIGELMRRVGKYDQSIKYFSKVIEQRKTTIETGIVSLAHDQWALARQEYREKKQEQIS